MDDFFDDYDDECGDLEFWDWAMIGGLSEELAREKREIERARREWDYREDDDYWDMINRRW